jgi:crotonobetainyl-CoA:carnitine CoA-transferase CaiB-like acyl-CoA transferase
MLDSQIALCENALVRYLTTGEVAKPTGSRHPLLTPFEIFPTRDGYVAVIASREDEWERFCKVVRKEDWIEDQRLRTNNDRLANYEFFRSEIEKIMMRKTTKDWIKAFRATNLPCGPVNTIDMVASDPHVQKRDMIIEIKHPRLQQLRVVGTPMKFSRTPCIITDSSPDLGEHTKEILKSLGLNKDDMEKLRQDRVVLY